MADTITAEQRSRVMALIRSRDTGPEMIVRRLCHALGFRYRIHVRSLPGIPDLVFPGRKKVIFVHGCFWHRHSCRRGKSMPKSRVEFWQEKFNKNQERDKKFRRILRREGWQVLVIWKCQLKNTKRLRRRLRVFLK